MQNKEIKKLIKRFSTLGIAIPGHIHKKYLKCGRDYCACMKSKKDLHGPYYFWQYKMNDKLTSKSISEGKLKAFDHWFKNRKLLETIISEVLDSGVVYVLEELKKNGENKSKIFRSSKRGM